MDKDDRRAIREALELALGIIEGHQNAEAARPSIDEALAILDKPEPVADGARELAQKIWQTCLHDGGFWQDEAAALITQVLREERREMAMNASQVILYWALRGQAGGIERLAEMVEAAIMGEEGK